MTNFERIKEMSLEEIAEAAVKEICISLAGERWQMSLLDATCYLTKEQAIAHNKKWLNATSVRRNFSSKDELRDWLETNRNNHDSKEEFHKWLERLFEDGNRLLVCDEEWDFDECLNLIYHFW